ncbi:MULTISPECIES: UPF0262 family protein [Hyphomicrobiales]|uniref:UPF0262 protein ABB55_22845 n=2 Tax=Prosthecodimorpha TaxID=2981530 RepID=A0A0P6VUM2_9HYPH|nr:MULTISPECIES: UPF0262 family protein [Hyphomicrobiales]KPL54710.1 hypothetical protein ABB55_22845 [Prosthecomicrobium hirschii]MBT9290322.1 UPF0262 family protein [Prosthecodimorpha staleyi]MCW1840428.1 UPF0262 family protein [Prosthecomicrobium hirschii]TPQ51185.1 UPF0262 family protein [Prosthecomicrobium hirschii]
MAEPQEQRPGARLIEIHLDDQSIARSTADVEHERAVAIYDLIEENHFEPCGHDGGPYRLRIGLIDNKLRLEIVDTGSDGTFTHILSLSPFRKIVKDYFMVCESYYAAIRSSTPAQIEAIDMGRRGLHNEGSKVLMDRLADKVTMDFDTARRLFTLVCALHWKG